MSVDNLYIEKQKSEKMDKSKKPTKGKGKAKLKVEGDNVSILLFYLLIIHIPGLFLTEVFVPNVTLVQTFFEVLFLT